MKSTYLNPHNGIRKKHTHTHGSQFIPAKRNRLSRIYEKNKIKITLGPWAITEHEVESATAGTKAGYSKTWSFWPDVFSLKLWRNSNR